MDFGAPIRPLGSVDITELRAAVLAIPESLWLADHALKMRDAPRRDTHHIYVWHHGGTEMGGQRCAGFESLHGVVEPVIEQLLTSYPPGGHVVQAMLARLEPGGSIPRHQDIGPGLQVAHRIHVPVVAPAGVEFLVADAPIETIEGEAFELNNQWPHAVFNGAATPRVHLVFDYRP